MLSPDVLPNYVFGGDTSVWEDNPSTPAHPDFPLAFRRGWVFNYLKASQGLFQDPDYKIHLAICKEANLLTGAYHFLQWNLSPEAQAEFFWNTVKEDGLALPLVCDFEWWSVIPSNAFDILYRFLERLKQLAPGWKIMIYTAYSFWKQYGKTDLYWSQYLIWLAHYDDTIPLGTSDVPAPWTRCDFWQFTGHGDGLYYGMESKDVDLDFFLGTKADLMQLCGLPVVDDPGTNDNPLPDNPNNGEVQTMLKMQVQVNVLNVRSGPGTTYSIVSSLPLNEIVTVFDVAGISGAWVKISETENKWSCVQGSNGMVYLKKSLGE